MEREDKLKDAKRPVQLFLFVRPVNSLLPPWRPLGHWAVVVVFPDGRVMTFELKRNEQNRNVAVCTEGWPSHYKEGILYPIGDIFTSPNKLLKLAKSVSLNGKRYKWVRCNCQMWCIEFCSKLFPELPSPLQWNIQHFLSVIGATALVVTTPILVSTIRTM